MKFSIGSRIYFQGTPGTVLCLPATGFAQVLLVYFDHVTHDYHYDVRKVRLADLAPRYTRCAELPKVS